MRLFIGLVTLAAILTAMTFPSFAKKPEDEKHFYKCQFIFDDSGRAYEVKFDAAMTQKEMHLAADQVADRIHSEEKTDEIQWQCILNEEKTQ